MAQYLRVDKGQRKEQMWKKLKEIHLNAQFQRNSKPDATSQMERANAALSLFASLE